MDVELIEKLAPHLAWPVVALVALPFIIWKVGQLSKLLIDYRKATEELPGALDKFEQLGKQLTSAEGQLSRVSQLVDQLNARQITDDSADIDAEAELSEFETDGPVPNEFENLSSEDLVAKLGEMDESWKDFLRKFDSAFERANLDKPDKRQVGAAAVELKDGRRRNHLEDEDVKLIARLHGQHMGFRRRSNEQIKEWLTSAVYRNFIDGVESAKQKIVSFSPR